MLELSADPLASTSDASRPLADSFLHYQDALATLAQSEPLLGLSGSAGCARHLKRTHGATLLTSGACIRTTAGFWLAHRERFPVVVRAIVLGLPIDAPKPPSGEAKGARHEQRA